MRAPPTASCSGRPKKARLDEGQMMGPAAGCIRDEACTCADVRVSTQCTHALAPPLATVDTGRGLGGADRGCPASASSQTPLQLRALGKFFFDSVEEEEAAEQAKIRPIARAGGRGFFCRSCARGMRWKGAAGAPTSVGDMAAQQLADGGPTLQPAPTAIAGRLCPRSSSQRLPPWLLLE